MSDSSRVWLITGTSTGLGRDIALCALRRGERVIATTRARSLASLDNLKEHGAAVLQLDVIAPLDELHEVAKAAVAIYGKIDVVVNNAGAIISTGAVEEVSPEDTFNQFNISVFGTLNVARAFLPYMRKQRSGLIIWMGSLAGWRGVPAVGLYSASKSAVRGISEMLDVEVQPLGIRSICIEPGYFRTNLTTTGHRSTYQNRIEDYKVMTEEIDQMLESIDEKQRGDGMKLAEIVVDIVRQEGSAKGKPMPTVLPIGADCVQTVRTVTKEIQDRVDLWEHAIGATDHSATN